MSGKDSAHPDKTDRSVRIEKLERAYDGFLKIDRATVTHSTADGGEQTITRECMERGDAAAVLLMDPDARTVWLLEQFRYPTLKKTGGWIVELPAGVIDDGEHAEEAAVREVAEETGFEVERIEPISTFYVSPGGTTERIFLYLAIVDGSTRDQSVMDALKDKDEDIRLIETPVSDFLKRARNGEINDAKTALAGLWLYAHRRRLGV